MPVSETDPGDKWFVATFKSVGPLADGTYELCGPHFNSNREKLDHDAFFRHGDIVLEGVPRDFNGIRAYLETVSYTHLVRRLRNHLGCNPDGLIR